ncbi:hypothetical protein [Streptomyces atriruber]|uniref:hypothetical protein n=1 Tax=Streptomyces atriruber TaxID=545121 RepID=UPI0006E15347|nr:hypothetical protein [Streptomyces atriruber]
MTLRASGSLWAFWAASMFLLAVRRSALAWAVSEAGGIDAFASAIAWATTPIQRDATSLYSPRYSVALADCVPHARKASPPSPCQCRPFVYVMRSSPILVIVDAALDNFPASWDAPSELADSSSASSCSCVIDSKSV